MNKLKQPKILTFLALMLAIQLILEKFLVLIFPAFSPISSKLGLGFLPIAIASAVAGPWLGGLMAGIGDFLGFFIASGGYAYFPGWTLSSAVKGIIYGLLLYKKPKTVTRIAIAELLQIVVVHLFLEPLWLGVTAGVPFYTYTVLRITNIPVVLAWLVRIPILYIFFRKTDVYLKKSYGNI